MFRESVAGADITKYNTYHGDPRDGICWFSYERKWMSEERCKNKENYRIHGSKI